MHANKREEITEVFAGDICAVGLRDTTTGDTLCDPAHPIVLEAIEFPDPVIQIAIEPKTKADQERLGEVAAEARERGSFVPRQREQRNRADADCRDGRVASGDHRRSHCCANSKSTPMSASRKSPIARRFGKAAEAEGRFVRQTGGHGQFGVVDLRIEPLAKGVGFEFVDDTKGGSIPRNFIPSVEDGMKEAMETGVLAGYPMVDIKASLLDGKYHEVDSSELAFKIAGSMGFKEAGRKGQPGAARAGDGSRSGHARRNSWAK